MRDVHCVIVENSASLVPILERELSQALAPEYRLIKDNVYESLDDLLNAASDDEASGAPQLFVVDLYRERRLRRLTARLKSLKSLWAGHVPSDASAVPAEARHPSDAFAKRTEAKHSRDASAERAEAKYLYDAVMDETVPKLRALRGRVGVDPVIVAISYIPKLLDEARAINADATTLRTAVRENVDMLIEKISREHVASEDFKRVKHALKNRHSNE